MTDAASLAGKEFWWMFCTYMIQIMSVAGLEGRGARPSRPPRPATSLSHPESQSHLRRNQEALQRTPVQGGPHRPLADHDKVGRLKAEKAPR